MAATIRLKRVGRKKQATFRIVVMDRTEGTAGRSVERLGIYNPRTHPSLIRLDAARALHWLREGAAPSDSVRSLLRRTGVWAQFHQGVAPEDLEQPIVVLGPEEGALRTSQRPAPGKPARGARRTPEPTAAEEEAAGEAAPEETEVGEPAGSGEAGEPSEARAAGIADTEDATDTGAAGEGPDAEKAPATEATDQVREASAATAGGEPGEAEAEPEEEGEVADEEAAEEEEEERG